MREILFRAKRIANGEWVEGYPQEIWGKMYIYNCKFSPPIVEVIPETVGQYTGLTDKNGKKIFEGDIVFGYARLFRSVVKWNSEQAGWSPFGDERTSFYADESEVVGNIHEEVAK